MVNYKTSLEPLLLQYLSGKKVKSYFYYFISEHLIALEDGTLVIISATLNTTGIYTCIAENTKGSDQKHFLVEVLGKYLLL
jgi:hypothetical protein